MMEKHEKERIEVVDPEEDEVEATEEYEHEKREGKLELVKLFDSAEVDLKSDLSDWKSVKGELLEEEEGRKG